MQGTWKLDGAGKKVQRTSAGHRHYPKANAQSGMLFLGMLTIKKKKDINLMKLSFVVRSLSAVSLLTVAAVAAPVANYIADTAGVQVYSVQQGKQYKVMGSGLGTVNTAHVFVCDVNVGILQTSSSSHADFLVPTSLPAQKNCGIYVNVASVLSNTKTGYAVLAATGAPLINSITDYATGQSAQTAIVGSGLYSLNGANLGTGSTTNVIVDGITATPLFRTSTKVDFFVPANVGTGNKQIIVTVSGAASNIFTATAVTSAPSYYSCSVNNPKMYQGGNLVGPCATSTVNESLGTSLTLNLNAVQANTASGCTASVNFGGAAATVTGCAYNSTSKLWELTFTTPVVGYGVTAVDATVNGVALTSFNLDWEL
jgi:hypothetical protein